MRQSGRMRFMTFQTPKMPISLHQTRVFQSLGKPISITRQHLWKRAMTLYRLRIASQMMNLLQVELFRFGADINLSGDSPLIRPI